MTPVRDRLQWVVLWLGLILGATAAMAQPTPPVRFTVFALRPPGNVALLGADSSRVPLRFFPTARSPHYEYRGPMPLRFVDAKSGETMATAEIPREIGAPLLLFLPNESSLGSAAPASSPPFRIAVIDDGAVRHPAGAVSIVNLSGLPLAGTVGRHAVTLKSGLNPPLAISRNTSVTLRTTSKQRTYTAYAGELELGRGERALLLLFPPFYKGSLEVQSRLLIDTVK